MSSDLIEAVKHAVTVAEQWLESEFRQFEQFMEPIVKEIGHALSGVALQDFIKLATDAAGVLSKPGAKESDIVTSLTADVRTMAPQLGEIALTGVVANIAASAKQIAATDPALRVNG